VAGACALAGALATAAVAVAAPTISLSPSAVTLGDGFTVSGTAPPHAALTLEADAWPFHGFVPLASATAGANGAYSFAPPHPDRNALLRVTAGSGSAAATSTTAALTVLPRVRLQARSLGPGRTLLTLGLRHVRTAVTEAAVVRWFARTPDERGFHLIAVSRSTEGPGGLLSAEVVVDPPARRFTFRVCLNPPWEAAMGTAAERGRCPRTVFVLPTAGARTP
jgi:hypothetical protein